MEEALKRYLMVRGVGSPSSSSFIPYVLEATRVLKPRPDDVLVLQWGLPIGDAICTRCSEFLAEAIIAFTRDNSVDFKAVEKVLALDTELQNLNYSLRRGDNDSSKTFTVKKLAPLLSFVLKNVADWKETLQKASPSGLVTVVHPKYLFAVVKQLISRRALREVSQVC